MRRLRHASGLLALALLVAMLAACGGDSEGGEGAETGEPRPITSPTGAACDGREPFPEADPQSYGAPPERSIDPSRTYVATLETSCGDIVITFDPELAPIAVNNFVFLAREGFYDGLTVHRVVDGFVIQSGDPEGTGEGGPGYLFEDELPTDGYPPGSVAMANAGPDTNGSQFFIVTGDASALGNDYTRFGEVTRGLDVARRIESFADPQADPADPAAQKPTEELYLYRATVAER
ncbi:MAG: peptidylprolyl isomerase [Solirubrobacterales bacterium]